MEKVFTIVAAAGQGRRVGNQGNKSFIEISGIPIIIHTLKALDKCHSCHDVAVVTDNVPLMMELLDIYKKDLSNISCVVVEGGAKRQDSVYNAFEFIPEDCDYVAIHDGARPFVSNELFERVFQLAKEKNAAIPGIPSSDTIKLIRHNKVERTIDRNRVLLVQTPQIFSKEILLAAYEKAYENGYKATDDSSVVEDFGCRVSVTKGDIDNKKITYADDLKWAKKRMGV